MCRAVVPYLLLEIRMRNNVFEELFVTFALLAPAVFTEALWVKVWRGMPSALSPHGITTLNIIFIGVTLYNLVYCIGSLIYIFVYHAVERKLFPPVAYWLICTQILILVGIAVAYSYLINHFPKQ